MSKLFSITAALACLMAAPAFAQEAVLNSGDTSWIMISSILVLMMSLPGLALFYGGLVHKDNVLATLMQTFVVAGVVGIMWPLFGYSLAFDEGSLWVGGTSKLFMAGIKTDTLSGSIPETVFVMFQLTFAVITTAIISGAVADRIKFSSLVVFSTIWVIVIYSPICHWVWGPGGLIGGIGIEGYEGFLGFGTALDFAGGTVVHISSGVAGLVAALVLGKGINKDKSSSNNLILSVMGCALLWVGWFGFNAGSALTAGGLAGMAMLVTNSAAASAMLTWLAIETIIKGKPSVVGAVSGVVAGLVAITPAAGFVTFAASIVIGAVGAIVCFLGVFFIKARFGYDDSLDAFGIHGLGGIAGAILTGVFASSDIGGVPGLIEGNGAQVMAQLVGVGATVLYSAIGTYIILKIISFTMGLRVAEDVEKSGLDIALHGDAVHVYR